MITSDEFIVRNNFTKFRNNAISFVASFFIMILIGLSRNKTPMKFELGTITILILIPIPLISYYLYNCMDKRPKIIINTNGIWTKKTSLIEWKDLWYFSLDEKEGRQENPKHLYLKLNNEKVYKISIVDYDKTKEEIHDAIAKFSSKTKVVDLGYFNDDKGSPMVSYPV